VKRFLSLAIAAICTASAMADQYIQVINASDKPVFVETSSGALIKVPKAHTTGYNIHIMPQDTKILITNNKAQITNTFIIHAPSPEFSAYQCSQAGSWALSISDNSHTNSGFVCGISNRGSGNTNYTVLITDSQARLTPKRGNGLAAVNY